MSNVVVRPPSAPRIDAYKVAVKYATDVIKGDIVAGKLLKLVAKRFIQDLKYGPQRGITFNKDAAQHVVDFFGTLRHSKGEWGKGGGQPFILSPWQTFILANLFGFRRANGTRRFREAHIEVARKNGKTTFMAGIGLYMMTADDEPGAEVYSIATTRDQSKIVFDEAVRMRKKSPYLSSRVASYRNNLSVLETASKFEPQSADYGTADGKNTHCLIADELHQHPTRLLYDAYKESTAARTQALCVAITTAGYDTYSFCFDQRKMVENILVGNVAVTAGDSIFAYIACIDGPDEEGKGGDDWKNEACWPKANPNLGVSVKLDMLREAASQADINPTALNSFLCKHLNVWTNQEIRWMPPDKWARCNAAGPLAVPKALLAAARERLKGRICIGGLDLSSKIDLTAFALLFPPVKAAVEKTPKPQTREQMWARVPIEFDEKIITPADPFWSVLVWFWVPEECVAERVKKDRVHYDVWKKEGYLNTCPGSTINHEFIYKHIVALRKDYQFTDIAFDSWNAQWISNKLKEDGFKPEECRMGYRTMSEPMKELMGMVLEKKLEHFGDPILAWNAGNVSATTDATGSIKPDKEKSKEKIDGVVSVIMALSRICADPTLAQGGSVYSERGIIFL
jgi:phage terminase large subunit-like protein